MEKKGPVLLVDIDGKKIAIPAAEVESVVETERVFFIPGKRPPVMGTISYRDKAVAVIDIKNILTGAGGVMPLTGGVTPLIGKDAGGGNGKPLTIIITSASGSFIGLCAGSEKPSLLWEDELKDITPPSAGKEKYVLKSLEHMGAAIEFINVGAIYDEAKSILSGG